MLSDHLLETFCQIDDFCQAFEPQFNKTLIQDPKRRIRKKSLSLSERLTILICFQKSGFRTFKQFYLHLIDYHRSEFPKLVTYHRFVSWIPSCVSALSAFVYSKKAQNTGISFIDSTTLKVCHNKRINRHKVFKGLARRGKSTMGYFYGFKLHIVISHEGEILGLCLSPGNVDDRKPSLKLCKKLSGKLFADKGYISKDLSQSLWDQGLQLITSLKKNMKNKLMPLWDKLMLRKRFLIETVFDQLKNVFQIEHSRHRSPSNFFAHLLAAVAAYTLKHNKPKINWNISNLPIA